MKPTLVLLILGLLPLWASAQTNKPRENHPLAPSLPLLSDREEEKIDNTIDRFIQYDMGQLRGEEGKKALQEFRQLGPEAIPGIIRGLNRAAKIESSCPAVTIAKKLAVMLRASNDPDLLDFARENIGAGITQSRHMAVIKDLRLLCILRKRAVGNNPVIVRTPPRQDQEPITLAVPDAPPADGPKPDAKSGDAKSERTLQSLAERNDDEALAELAKAASSKDKPTQQRAQDLLTKVLSRQSTEALKDKLKHTDEVIRATAARVVGSKRLPLGADLIDLLSDDAAEVRQAAHQSLVRLNHGTDLGPAADADEAERAAAIKKWRDRWAK
jgi:hypothetical protein